MIAFLQGVLHSVQNQRVVVDVAGVGYELYVPASTLAQLPAPGAAVSLEVHMHVRDDAIQLFGFATRREKALFERLIAVSNVGPKLALAILSGLEVETLVAAIRGADLARLAQIPGVGRKTAERVVVELRDKLEPGEPQAAGGAAAPPALADLVSALVNLGYAPFTAEQAARQARAQLPQAGLDELLAACLRLAGRG